MTRWTIKLIMDGTEHPAVPATTTLSARKAMLAGVQAMTANMPNNAPTLVPSLAAPTGERHKQYIVNLGGDVSSTTYVLVDAWRTEMYP